RTEDMDQEVQRVDGMRDESSSQLGLPFSPPCRRIVVFPPAPGRFRCAEVRRARDSLLDQDFQLLQPVAEAVLEYRHEDSAGSLLRIPQAVHFLQGAGQGLFA